MLWTSFQGCDLQSPHGSGTSVVLGLLEPYTGNRAQIHCLQAAHQGTVPEVGSKLQNRSVGRQVREKVMALPGPRELELTLFLTMTGTGL